MNMSNHCTESENVLLAMKLYTRVSCLGLFRVLFFLPILCHHYHHRCIRSPIDPFLSRPGFPTHLLRRLESRSGWDTFQRPPFRPLAQLRDTLLWGTSFLTLGPTCTREVAAKVYRFPRIWNEIWYLLHPLRQNYVLTLDLAEASYLAHTHTWVTPNTDGARKTRNTGGTFSVACQHRCTDVRNESM